MTWWVTLLVYVVGTVLYELLRPKMKFDTPQPSSIGDFTFPTIGEGRPIPIVWGTCKIAGPMVTWYGDLLVQAVKKWVSTGWFTGTHVTIGYKYWLGISMVLCSGELDEIVEVKFDDRTPPQERTVESDRTRLFIDAQNFYGGRYQEGGIWGSVYVYHGTETQEQDSYLRQHVGEDPPADLPAYRGISYAVFPFTYLGMSPYIKEVSFVVRRFPNQLGLSESDKEINGDANAAAMIYEILTAPQRLNGLGFPEEMVDVAAFRAAGETLKSEELGLSMLQDQTMPARDLILEVLRHIDGILYVEPSTGLVVLKLVRFDYVADDLPVLDSSNCTVKSFSRPSWGEMKNTVRVAYVNRNEGGGIT